MEHKSNIKEHINTSHYYIAGPLNLDREQKKASTVMGGNLGLDGNEFDALYMLATNEGKYLSYQQIANASKGIKSETAIKKLVEQINTAGDSFMWIEFEQGSGYMFKTSWGRNWSESKNTNDSVNSITEKVNASTEKKGKSNKTSLKTFVSGAGALAAIILLALFTLLITGVIAPTSPDPVYIEAELEEREIPLATLSTED